MMICRKLAGLCSIQNAELAERLDHHRTQPSSCTVLDLHRDSEAGGMGLARKNSNSVDCLGADLADEFSFCSSQKVAVQAVPGPTYHLGVVDHRSNYSIHRCSLILVDRVCRFRACQTIH